MTTRIAVIGGGIAGLSAAHRLVSLDPGLEIELHEATPRLGGNIKTSRFAGRNVDEAADAFLTRVPWALDLCAELGIDDLVHPADLSAGIWHDGAIHPLPTPNVLGVPTDVEALRSTSLVGDDAVAALAADADGRSPVTDHGDSLGVLLRSRLGDTLTDRIVEPLLHGVYAAPVDQLSLATVTPQFAAAADAPSFTRALAEATADRSPLTQPLFAAPRDGMQVLIDALAARLDDRVHLRSTVESLESRDDRVDLTIDGSIRRFDYAVLATPGHVTARFLPLVPAAAALDTHPVSVAFVTVAIDPDHLGIPLDHSGFLVPADARRRVTACSFTSAKWPHLAGDPAVVRAAVGRADDDTIVAADDDTIVDAVMNDLDDMLGLTGSPVEVRVSRWPRSFPRYRPGHLDRIARVTEALAGSRVAIAGAATSGIGIPTCIHGADVAARRIVSRI